MATNPTSVAWLEHNPDFDRTSYNPSWQGKVQCRHCGKTGWPGSPLSPRWWGNKHGPHCTQKPLEEEE